MPGHKSVNKGRRRERNLAKLVGGQRTGIVGQGEKPDVEDAEFVYELKSRMRLPVWMIRGIGQAQAAGFTTGKEGILVIEQCDVGKEPLQLFCHLSVVAWRRHHGQEVGNEPSS